MNRFDIDATLVDADVTRGRELIATITPELTLDRRDRPLDPRRGSFHLASVEVGSFVLGGDSDFLKTRLETAWYLDQLRPTVLAVGARLGLATPLGDTTDLPIEERCLRRRRHDRTRLPRAPPGAPGRQGQSARRQRPRRAQRRVAAPDLAVASAAPSSRRQGARCRRRLAGHGQRRGAGTGLGLFGFQPAATSITAAEVERMIRARLGVDEARRLDLVVEEAEIEAAWRALADRRGGSAALAAWLTDNAIEPAWARGRLADHLRHERFLELRFRAFVFVLEEDISTALGPGEHPPAARDRAREQLRAEIVGRRLAEWLQEAARRTRIRRLLPADQEVPLPWGEALSPGIPSGRAGEDGESRRARPGVAREGTQ